MRRAAFKSIWFGHSFRFLRILGALIVLAGAVALLRDTALQGQDFAVFWRAARTLWSGQSLYDLERDGAMVFKYPPWIATFFTPFACLPLDAAKWVWGAVELAALAYCVKWLSRRVHHEGILWIAVFGFWGIWAVHAMDGQINLVLLAGVLWAWESDTVFARVTAIVLLSTKIFTGFALIAWFLRDIRRSKGGLSLQAAVWAVAVFVVFSFPAVLSQNVSRASSGSRVEKLSTSWWDAAASGGTQFEGEKIRGRGNQGFPALILRAMAVPARETRWDLVLFAVTAFAASGAFVWASTWVTAEESVGLALGLMVVAHPLAWFHLYVFAFPLTVLALERAWDSRKWQIVTCAFLGAFLLAAISRKTLGVFGARLELFSIKAWGVLFLAYALVQAVRIKSRR